MSNNISLVGRLGGDPELKSVGSTNVLKFTLANNTGFGDRKITNWFSCDLWGTRGEKLQQYLTKGKEIFVTGELSLRKYTANDGTERTSADLNVSQLDFISGGNNEGGAPAQESPSAPAAQTQQASNTPETEEDLPF